MYRAPHPESSGQQPDTTILHCKNCGYAGEPFRIGSAVTANACPYCRHHGLSFINYHAETESDLAKRVLAEEIALARKIG